MKNKIVEIIDVKKIYGKSNAINGISCTLNSNEEYVIRGSSGCGKSTLLYLLGGLDRPSVGKIIVNGFDLNNLNDDELAHYRNQFVGFVFQFHFLLPSMTALDNILLPARLSDGIDTLVKERVLLLAKKLGVDHLLSKFPYELSGGEQQRVNIIRALSLKPKLLLCDEPTGNLDSENSAVVMKLLRELSKENEATLVVVTHDLIIADSFQNQLIMKDGKFLTL